MNTYNLFPSWLRSITCRSHFFTILLLCFSIPTWCQDKYSNQNPIRIGVLHSLNGTMAISERSLVDAIRMAVDEINIKGGIQGRRIEVIVEDGQSDPDVFARKAEKLILRDRVSSIFGCWTSNSRKKVLPVVEKYKSLLWYPVQYEGGESSPNIIYTGAAPNQQIIPALEWSFNKLGKRFFLIGSDYVFPKEANKIVKAYLKREGGLLLGEEYVPLGSQDFSEIIEMIKTEKPDVVFNTINGDSNIGFFLGLNSVWSDPSRVVPVISMSLAEEELRSLGTKMTAGHYCAWNYFQSIDTDENLSFVDSFKKKYGSSRVTDDPIEAAYFQVYLFAEAIRRANSVEPLKIRDAVHGIQIQAPGGIVKVDETNQHVWKSARIGMIRLDGQFDILWSSPAPVRPDPYPILIYPNAKRSVTSRSERIGMLDKQWTSISSNELKATFVKELLQGSDQEDIKYALDRIAKGSLNQPSLVEPLIHLLDNEDLLIQQQTLETLSFLAISADKVLPYIIKQLDHSRVGMRVRARRTLLDIIKSLNYSNYYNELPLQLNNAVEKLHKLNLKGDKEALLSLRFLIREIEDRRRAGFWNQIFRLLDNTYLRFILGYTFLFLFVWLILLRFFPLSILHLNNFIKDRAQIKIFGDLDVSFSIRYLLIVGFFQYSPRVLDAWVKNNLGRSRINFNNLDTVKRRITYLPVPVEIDSVIQPSASVENFMDTCSQNRWCVLINGEGGVGKTALACQLGMWAMEEDSSKRLNRRHLSIPLLLEPGAGPSGSDIDSLRATIAGQLAAMLESNEVISNDFLNVLLRKGRIVIIIDDVSALFGEDWRLPYSPDFPIASLIVTSRVKDRFGNIPTLSVEPLKISGERLSSFMDAYLRLRKCRNLFSDADFFKACEKLTLLVGGKGNRTLTVLFAKLYAEQMIGAKTNETSSSLPDSIPGLILGYLNELNRTNKDKLYTNRIIQIKSKAIAWLACQKSYQSDLADYDETLVALGEGGEDIFNYLETNLRIVQRTGLDQKSFRFTIDPLCEYLGGMYISESYGNDSVKWNHLLTAIEQEKKPASNRSGFLMALLDCVVAETQKNTIPIFVFERLSLINGISQPSEGKIKVGVLHSLTGSMAISERSLVDSIRLAVSEINDAGGIANKRIELIIEDGASDPSVFARKAKKLITEDRVCSVFGCWTSDSRKAVLPIFEEFDHLLWYPVQYEGNESSKNVIYTGAAPNQQILPAVQWCLDNLGQKIYLVGSDYIFPREANRLIKSYLKNLGLQICGESYLPLGSRDFAAIIEEIKRVQPSVIFNTVNGDSNMGLFYELDRAQISSQQTPVMSVSIAEDELLGIGTGLTAGNYCAWTYFQSINTIENQNFVDAFKRANGMNRVTDDPIEAAYAQVKLFAKALAVSGIADPQIIRKDALNMTFMAPSGELKIDPQNQHTWKEPRIGKIQPDGQFDIVWEFGNSIKPEPYSSL